MSEWWRRPRVWFFVLLATAAVLLGSVTLFLRHEGRTKANEWAGTWSWYLTAIGALMPLLIWLWRQARDHTTPTGELVDTAMASLGRAQTEQWQTEENARRIQDPWPLPVRWEITDRARAVMAGWPAIRGFTGAGPISLDGNYYQIADVFTAPGSPRRLVILGKPGAGKSILALRLALDLLCRRARTDPVPVVLSIATWNPEQPLDDWIADRLATENPSLVRLVQAPDGTKRSLARELVAADQILPILDGLDEMAVDHRVSAVAAIADTLGPRRQFVLTSRTVEYEQAVVAGRLARTPVVEIQPLSLNDVANYLTDGTEDPLRWTNVVAHLRTNTETPLTQTLSSPLMAWLTRVVYQQASTDPEQMLTAAWSDNSETIEQQLLGSLIPAVYTSPVGNYPRRTQDQAQRTQRWLTNIARRLHNSPTTYDLAWWRLDRKTFPLQVRLAVGLTVGLAAGLLVGLSAAFPIWLVNAVGFAAGYSAFLAAGLEIGDMFTLVIVTSGPLLLLAPVAQTRGSRSRLKAGSRQPLQVSLRFDSARLGAAASTGFSIGLLTLVAAATVAGFRTGLSVGVTAGVTATVAAALLADADVSRTVSPTRLLGADRIAAFWAAAPFGLVVGLAVWFAAGPKVGLAAGLAAGFEGVLVTAWGRFCFVRVLLVLHDQTPVRLMTSLKEAHDRGVMRQVGGVYQFRHARLQQHLANTRDGELGIDP